MSPPAATADRYRHYARYVARCQSPLAEALAAGVAGDAVVLEFLDALPPRNRHPQLFFAAAGHLGGQAGDYGALRAWFDGHRAELAALLLRRAPQMNDAGRCAPLLPLLSLLPQPIALIEVGASAGLCLYPDLFSYDYDGHLVGDRGGPVLLRCSVTGGPPLPPVAPVICWRMGLDLDPLDLADAEDARWLEAFFWPGMTGRIGQFRAAVRLVARQRPAVVRGDLSDGLAGLAAQAPRDATLVVSHSAALSYAPPPARERFARHVRDLGAHWVFQELPDVFPEVTRRAGRWPRLRQAVYVVALDGAPVAFADIHGRWLDWIAGPAPAPVAPG